MINRSLSFIFLFSASQQSLLSKMTSDQKIAVVNDLHAKKHFNSLDEKLFNTCYKVNRILQNYDMNKDETNDKLYSLRSSASSQGKKAAITIMISRWYFYKERFLDFLAMRPRKKANLIWLRPFVNNRIITPTRDTKYEWYVLLKLNNKLLINLVLRVIYWLVPIVGSYTVMLSDFILWVVSHSEASFESEKARKFFKWSLGKWFGKARKRDVSWAKQAGQKKSKMAKSRWIIAWR